MSANPILPHGWLQTPSRVRFQAECAVIPVDSSSIGLRGRPRLSTRTVSIPVPIHWMNGLHHPVIQLDHQDPSLPCAHKNPSFTLKLPSVTRKLESHNTYPPPNTKSCLRSPSSDEGSSSQTTDPVLPLDARFRSSESLASPVPLTPPPESDSSPLPSPLAGPTSSTSYFSPRFRRGSTSHQPDTIPLRACCSRCLFSLSKAMFQDHVKWSPGAWRKKMMDEKEERNGNGSIRNSLMLKVDEIESGKVNVRGTRSEEYARPGFGTDRDEWENIAESSRNASRVDLLDKEPKKNPQVHGMSEEDPDSDALDSLRLAELLGASLSSEPNSHNHGPPRPADKLPDRAQRPTRPLPPLPIPSFTPSAAPPGTSELPSDDRRRRANTIPRPQFAHAASSTPPPTNPPPYADAPWPSKPVNLFNARRSLSERKSSADLTSSKTKPHPHSAETSQFLGMFTSWARIGNVV